MLNRKPKSVPFDKPPATAQWDYTIRYDDYTKLLAGYLAQSMDEKWTILTDAPEDGQSNAIVHIYFGWKNYEEMALTVKPGDPNDTTAEEWATITEIAWKEEHPGPLITSEAEAKSRAIRMCNALCGCALEPLEEEEDEDEESDEEEDEEEEEEETGGKDQVEGKD
jgi:hypothetical protein